MDGWCGMGSPMGPVLANLFSGYYEQKWLQLFEECVISYHRFIDDIICLFNSELDTDKCFVFLNQQQPNLKFKIENKQITNFHF